MLKVDVSIHAERLRSSLKCQRDNEVGDAQAILPVLFLNTQCHYSFWLPPDGKDVGIEISLTFALIQLHLKYT